MKAHAIAALCVLLSAAAAPSARAAAPEEPQDVRKDRIGDNQVRITWDDVANEDGYDILRKPAYEAGAEFELRETVGANVTEFVDQSPRSPVFIYRVRAFNEDGDSDLSNECFVNRPRPPSPLSFNVRLIALTVAKISWSDIASAERGYEIQRAEPGHRFRTVVKLPTNTESYEDYSLHPATDYIYRVRALGRPAICWDNGKFSPERAVTTDGTRRTLQVNMNGQGRGRVRSIPEGINCDFRDDRCIATFPWNDVVVLEADPNDSSRFAGWTGITACEDTKGPCTFHMSQDREIGATFRKID